MEQTISQTTSFNPVAAFNTGVDDHWILDQLFGIRNLEKKIQRAIVNCGGRITDAIQRDMSELNEWVARFDEALDSNAAPKPAGRSQHARVA